jgi:hypothetical protein
MESEECEPNSGRTNEIRIRVLIYAQHRID